MSIFSKVPIQRPKRTMFDLSHEKKLSFNMGDLIPILCQDVVPGDTFRVNTESMIRFAPMLAPIMHRVNVFTHYFFVPNRIAWEEWERFITGGDNGVDNPVFPRIAFDGDDAAYFAKGTLADYLGFPVIPAGAYEGTVSQLPFRAYALIYNEYYRDQSLQAPVSYSLSSNILNPGNPLLPMTLRKRAWEKDYFTSALPWAQRGGDVNIPLYGEANVTMNDTPAGGSFEVVSGTKTGIYGVDVNFPAASDRGLVQTDGTAAKYDPNGTLSVDLDGVTSATINELRQAVQLQKWLERNARSGSRYVEQILAHFGVKSSDARLQRPEYLGGGKVPVVISEVLQTSSTDATSPLGEMAGHGISVGNTHQFKRFFEEHGQVIGIMSVLPKTSYQQGVPRQFLKFDRFDFYWPEFAHLGEQEIKNQELYFQANTANNDAVFGYTPRYAEYKFCPSTVHGDFKDELSFWHMGRIFSAPPALNSSFVSSDPTHRIFSVTDPNEHKLWCQVYHNIKAIRPMPYFGAPGNL